MSVLQLPLDSRVDTGEGLKDGDSRFLRHSIIFRSNSRIYHSIFETRVRYSKEPMREITISTQGSTGGGIRKLCCGLLEEF